MEEEKQIHPLMDKRLEEYCQKMCSNDNEALKENVRQTHLRFVKPNMVSDSWQGAFLMFLCSIVKPKNILEIGTFSGYSTLCFALASEKDCHIDTLECMEEYGQFLSESFKKNGVEQKIEIHFGQAMETIPKLKREYDLVFIDAEKVHYPQYYDLCKAKLRKGGVLLADNILWYGKVALKNVDDKQTNALREFNVKVTQDREMENFIVPIRDGIMVARKI